MICQLSVSQSLPNIAAHCDIGGIHTRFVTSTQVPFSLAIFRNSFIFQQVASTDTDLVTFNMDLSTANSVWRNNARVKPDSRSCKFFIRYM